MPKTCRRPFPRSRHPGRDVPVLQVVEANGFVFLAGQVGDVPGSRARSRAASRPRPAQMLDNVGHCSRRSAYYGDVVKATVYLKDFGDFAAMNAIYRTYFPTDPPTRATVGVTALAADYRVEVEVLAVR